MASTAACSKDMHVTKVYLSTVYPETSPHSTPLHHYIVHNLNRKYSDLSYGAIYILLYTAEFQDYLPTCLDPNVPFAPTVFVTLCCSDWGLYSLTSYIVTDTFTRLVWAEPDNRTNDCTSGGRGDPR